MAESKTDRASQLRRQADSTEQRSRKLFELSVLFAGSKYYDQTIFEAQSLAAEAVALRDHASRLEKAERVQAKDSD